MNAWIALIRAVNVGGTGKLPSADLKAACEAAGFTQVRTYLASGNALFVSEQDEAGVRDALVAQLTHRLGKAAAVLVRSPAELTRLVAGNPFADEPGNRVVALFSDEPPPLNATDGVTHVVAERLSLGERAIFIAYGDGMADSRIKIPATKNGTARNMNTVAKLAELGTAMRDALPKVGDTPATR